MKLYGWGKPDGDPDQKALYNTFMAVNNSTYDDKGGNRVVITPAPSKVL